MRSTTRGTRVPGASAHLPAATRPRGCHAAPLAAVACVLLLATCAAAFGPAGVHEAFNVSTQSKCQSSAAVVPMGEGAPDAVFFATIEPDNTVYRINGATGAVQWKTSLGYGGPKPAWSGGRNGMRDSPVVAGGLLHIGTDNNTFVALDIETGARVWTHNVATAPTPVCLDPYYPLPEGRPCEVYSSALVAGGLRFQGSEDNHTRCFNASTGDLLWDQDLKGMVSGTPVAGVAGSSSIWIGADDGYLHNLDVATGKDALPPILHCGIMESQPVVDLTKGVLFSMCRRGYGNNFFHPASDNGAVFAVDMQTGSFLWKISCAGGAPAYAPDLNAVFVAGENGTAFAADATTGEVLWEQHGIKPIARFMGPFAYDARRGLVYGANLAGVVCALKAATGEVVWTWLLKSKYTPLIPVPLGPRISSDFSLLYFGAYDRAFHALHLP